MRSYNSGAQAKIVGLEAELESTRKTLSEARRELADSRRDAKVDRPHFGIDIVTVLLCCAVLRAFTSLNSSIDTDCIDPGDGH